MLFKKLLKRIKNDTAGAQSSAITTLASQRAEYFYESHKLCCSEAVLVVVNEAFGGGLTPDLALRLGSPYCHGMGGAGCVCGALNGAELALALFLSPHHPEGLSKKKFRALCKELHDRFRERFNATCCRVLTKKVKDDKQAHAANCQMLTGAGAELVTEILLEARPKLAEQANLNFLEGRDKSLAQIVKNIVKR